MKCCVNFESIAKVVANMHKYSLDVDVEQQLVELYYSALKKYELDGVGMAELEVGSKIYGLFLEKGCVSELDYEECSSIDDLDDKVNSFVNWYYKSLDEKKYGELARYHLYRDIKNFIEKMAVWYELRYPSYELYVDEHMNVDKEMFEKNKYLNKVDMKDIKWSDFYNKDVFINSLPWEERRFIYKEWYSSIAYLIPNRKAPFNLFLTKDGYVEKSENVSKWTDYVIKDEELVGMHAKNVVKLFSSKGIVLPENNQLEETINFVDKQQKIRNGVLDCVMYRIIERGGSRVGPRRAYLFAKEFERNIDIPMKYSVDYSDPRLRSFMNQYIKDGGSKDLKCYVNYFSRIDKTEKLETVTIQDLIMTLRNDAVTFYTSEEMELFKRLAVYLNNKLDYEILKDRVRQIKTESKKKKYRK